MLGAAAPPLRKGTGPTCSLKHSHKTVLVTGATRPLTAPPYLLLTSGSTTRWAHPSPGFASVDGRGAQPIAAHRRREKPGQLGKRLLRQHHRGSTSAKTTSSLTPSLPLLLCSLLHGRFQGARLTNDFKKSPFRLCFQGTPPKTPPYSCFQGQSVESRWWASAQPSQKSEGGPLPWSPCLGSRSHHS